MADRRKKPRQTSTVSPIAQARMSANLTQAQLASMIGVAPQQIGAWERGERNPKLDALRRISEALGCDIQRLIS